MSKWIDITCFNDDIKIVRIRLIHFRVQIFQNCLHFHGNENRDFEYVIYRYILYKINGTL